MTTQCIEQGNPVSTETSSGDIVTVKVLQTVAQVEQERALWTLWPGHRDSEIDFYLMILASRPEVLHPYILVSYRNNSPKAMLIGRVEQNYLDFRVGYFSALRAPARILSFIAWGLRGDASPESSRVLIEEVLKSLRRGEADAAALTFLDVNSAIFKQGKQLPGILSRDFLTSVNVHWRMDLANSVDEVSARFSSDHRGQLRRKAKRLIVEFGNKVKTTCLVSLADVDRIMKDVEEVAKKTYQRGLGVGFSVTEEMRNRLCLQAEKRWLRTYILYIDDRPCAFWVGSLYDGLFYSDYLGHDPAYDKHSVGTFLTMKTIEALCLEGAKGIDFGPGDSRYKQQFGNSRTDEATVYIFAPSLKGIALNAGRTVSGYVDDSLKKTLERTQLLPKIRQEALAPTRVTAHPALRCAGKLRLKRADAQLTSMAAAAAEKVTPEKVESHRSLAGAIGKGTIFGVVANLVRFGTRLILVPILIAHLGLGGYGIWATLMVIAGYLRFGSAGVKTCFQKYVAEAYANGDFEHANRLVTTGTTIFVAMSAVVLIPVAIFPYFVAHLAGIPQSYMPASAAAITLLAIAYLISNAIGVFESAVLGAHRVDLMQRFTVAATIFELVFYVIVLRMGYGLATLILGMAIGELGYGICGVLAAQRVVPQISLRPKYFTPKVIRELVRFTGSYQLLNLMEVFYVGVVPIVLLRELGPEAAGVFAICDRLTRFATMGLESSLVPLLSGSTMIFSLGFLDRMRAFLLKAFKLCLVATLLPLAFVSVFGAGAVLAWTGQANHLFRLGIVLVALTALFRSLSKVGMVIYRSTGGASMDSGAQLIRIAILLFVVILGKRWGFYGAVSGLVLAEFVGMIVMLEALFRRLGCFSLRQLFALTAHLSASVAILIIAGEAIAFVPLPFRAGSRLFVSAQLGLISVVVLALVWPAFILTDYLSLDERSQILNTLLPWRHAVARAH